MARHVFITGGTGYLGQRLIAELINRGHHVRALVRPGSESKLANLCEVVTGNALEEESFLKKICPADTFVHLVGVPRPSPAKAKQFREIDLVSIRASVPAALKAGIEHFVYLSVAQPAPIMKVYQEVRAEGERLVRDSGMNATILRPWYVLGPGHWWPYLLLPAYKLLEMFPATKESAARLGLVTIDHMTASLINAIETDVTGVRIVDVPQIRASKISANP
jgi:uncharacterized protein YbjT (DUF2867 family)